MPSLGLVAAESVGVVVLTACLTLIGGIFISETFAHHHSHGLAGFALKGDFGETREVLPHVKKDGRRIDGAFGRLTCSFYLGGCQLVACLDRKMLHNLHRRCHLGVSLPLGARCTTTGFQALSLNPALFQPGCSRRAS